MMVMMVGSFLVGGELLYHLCFIFVFCLWGGGMICGKILGGVFFPRQNQVVSTRGIFFFFFWSPGSGRRKGRKNRNPRFFHALHLSICFSATLLLFSFFSPLWFPELYFQPMPPLGFLVFWGGSGAEAGKNLCFRDPRSCLTNTPPPPEVQLAEKY